MRPQGGPCEHETAGGVCGSTEEVRRFLTGLRCPAHTPAAVAGRAEAAAPGLHVYPEAIAACARQYGKATTDPLGRTSSKGKGGLPTRAEGDPGPEDAPWMREKRIP